MFCRSDFYSYFCKVEEKNKDEMYMRKALQEAEAAMAEGEIPIGAVIVCQDHDRNAARRDGPCRDAGHYASR